MGNKPSYFAKAPENVARVFLTGREHQEGFPWPPLHALVRPRRGARPPVPRGRNGAPTPGRHLEGGLTEAPARAGGRGPAAARGPGRPAGRGGGAVVEGGLVGARLARVPCRTYPWGADAPAHAARGQVCRGRNGPWVRTNFVSAVFGFAILAIAVQQILPSGLGGHIKIEGGVMQRVPWFLVIMLPPLFGFFGASMAASKAMKAFGPTATRILQTQSGSTSLVVKVSPGGGPCPPARRCEASWASALTRSHFAAPHFAQSYSHWLQKGQTEGPQGWEGNCTEPRIYWLDFEDSSAAPRASGQLAAGAPMPGYPGDPIARPAAAPKAETAPPAPQPAFGEEHQEATFGGDGATFGGGSTTFGGGATFGSSDLFEKK